jgi:hypothetical protein
MDAAAAQAELDAILWHTAIGATSKSVACGLDGLAAGHICKPRFEGTARASFALQENGEDEGTVLPAEHVAHAPEHAAVERPAWSPKVPAGQREHTAAPISEYVPGLHGTQAGIPL